MEKTLIKLNAGEPVTIVVVGDSNTIVSMNTQGRLNWVGYLTEALWERYGDGVVTMINVSECGYSYSRLVADFDRKIARWQPDLAVCHLWLAGDSGPEPGALDGPAAFREVVRRLREIGSAGAELLVSTQNPRVLCHGHDIPDGAEPGTVYEIPSWNTARNAELVALAKANNCAVVDHFTAWQKKRYTFAHAGANPRGLWQRMIDPVHPNALGQLMIFREMASLFDVATHFPWEEIEDAQ